MPNAISVKNVSYTYSTQNQNSSVKKALDDVSFEIVQGSYTAVVGPNGSGKSTAFRLVCGLLENQSGSINLLAENRIGLVFQSPKDQIISGKVYRDTAFGPQTLGFDDAEVELRTIECLSAVELLEKAEESSNSLSLGQTQKLALSGVLSVMPQVLILDEAVAMIDPESRECIYEFLREWHKKGYTIIHITHDIEAISEAEKVIGFENGKIFYDGEAKAFLENQEYFLKIIGKPLEKNDRKSVQKKFDEANVTLSLKNVCFSYPTENSFVKDISFDLYKGTLTALTGPSGAGKSTILELAAGLLTPDSGEIFCNSKPSLVQQNCSSALFEEFAADDVAFGPRNEGIHGKELKQIVRSSMDAAGIPFDLFSERHSAQLSGGEKRRLAIAGILALNKDVVFFDEPTAGLDGESRITVMKLLRKLADEGKTVLFTTHRIDEEEFADRQIDLNFGKIVSDTLNISSENELSILHPYESAAILSKLENVSRNLSGSDWQNKSVLEKISPVLRILIFLFIFVIALSFSNIYLCAGAFLISLIYCKCAKFNMKRLFTNLLKILPFLLIFAVFQMMFRKPLPDEPCFTSWKWFLVTPSKIIFCIAAIIKTYAALSCIKAPVFV